MTSPIFVLANDGELMMFESPERVTAYVESPDVEAGEYTGAFDAEGWKLILRVSEPTRRRRFLGIQTVGLTKVLLDYADPPENCPADLANDLRRALNIDDTSIELAELVEQAQRKLKWR